MTQILLFRLNETMEHPFWQNSRTSVKIQTLSDPLKPNESILLLGSCFAQNLGQKMQECGLPALVNPFGLLYNPHSLAWALDQLTLNARAPVFRAGDFFHFEGQWRHKGFHTDLCRESQIDALSLALEQAKKGSQALQTAKLLVITLGTAYLWRHRQTGEIWSNCHRLPQQTFARELGEIPSMVQDLDSSLQRAQELNPGLKVLFTVSPTRYLRDGGEGNFLSKSLLRVTVEALLEKPNRYYFPAYELLIDELRDYRWYERDRAHPSAEATEYIMERFAQTWTSPDWQKQWREGQDRLKREAHRPHGKKEVWGVSETGQKVQQEDV